MNPRAKTCSNVFIRNGSNQARTTQRIICGLFSYKPGFLLQNSLNIRIVPDNLQRLHTKTFLLEYLVKLESQFECPSRERHPPEWPSAVFSDSAPRHVLSLSIHSTELTKVPLKREPKRKNRALHLPWFQSITNCSFSISLAFILLQIAGGYSAIISSKPPPVMHETASPESWCCCAIILPQGHAS